MKDQALCIRWYRMAVTAAVLAAGTVIALDPAYSQPSRKSTAAGQTAPGSVIDSQPLQFAPEGATAYRVRYRSTGLKGEAIPVSGAIFIPSGPVPSGGRPVIAWAHPTTGVVDRCAPSTSSTLYMSIQGLRDMLRRGFIVAATDYPGLGTPGPHPYLVGDSEGRSVIDSVRAARHLAGPGGASREFAVWGHSQGGHAALFTGLIARRYAPELSLLGVAAAAPATELATLLTADLNTSGGKNIAAMALWSWSRVFGAPIEKVVAPEAIPVVDELANDCLETISDVLARLAPSRALERRFLTTNNFAEQEPWRSLLARNSPGTLPPEIPVFIAQGGADELVLPRVTDDFRNRLCRAGSRVAFNIIPGVSHLFIARDAAPAAIDWMQARFAREPAPSNCGRDPVR